MAVSPIDPYVPPNIPNNDPTSLHPGKYNKPLVLNRVFKLLTKMISILQAATAAQSNRLTFLTNWQQAYTDSLNQIHAFAQGNGDAIDSTSTSDMNLRNDLNQVNSTYTEEIRGNRTLISNAAQGLQTNVNQGNDAVNQQTNLATSIVQEMSQILGTIYH